jgi:quinol monooxygenase YgiN
MPLHLIARFHVRAGAEPAAEEALREVAIATRGEPGCLDFQALHAIHDPALFYIHSTWRDEAAFNAHSDLPHTVRYIESIDGLIDQPREISLTELLS